MSHSVISLGGHFGRGLPGTPLTLHTTELYFIMLVPKDLGSSPGACASHGPNSHTRTLRPIQCHLQQLHFMAHRSLATPSTNNKFFRFLPLTVPLLILGLQKLRVLTLTNGVLINYKPNIGKTYHYTIHYHTHKFKLLSLLQLSFNYRHKDVSHAAKFKFIFSSSLQLERKSPSCPFCSMEGFCLP